MVFVSEFGGVFTKFPFYLLLNVTLTHFIAKISYAGKKSIVSRFHITDFFSIVLAMFLLDFFLIHMIIDVSLVFKLTFFYVCVMNFSFLSSPAK